MTVVVRGVQVRVDPADVPLCLSLRLRVVDKTRHATRKLYVEDCRYEGGRTVHRALHRVLMGVTDPNLVVDHTDGDGLNNERSNLRVCDRRRNAWNARPHGASRYKGVSFHAASGRWRAQIQAFGVRRHLGSFGTELDAAGAYAVAARELHGEYAWDGGGRQ